MRIGRAVQALTFLFSAALFGSGVERGQSITFAGAPDQGEDGSLDEKQSGAMFERDRNKSQLYCSTGFGNRNTCIVAAKLGGENAGRRRFHYRCYLARECRGACN